MAKAKGRPAGAEIPDDEREDIRITIVALKGTPKWRAWLRRLAEHDQRGVVPLIEEAIRDRAKAIGFPERMPRREPKGGSTEE